MSDAERIAALEAENRLLRAAMNLEPRERSLVFRLAEGPATLDELRCMIEAEHGDAVTPSAVSHPIQKARRKLRPLGYRIDPAIHGQPYRLVFDGVSRPA